MSLGYRFHTLQQPSVPLLSAPRVAHLQQQHLHRWAYPAQCKRSPVGVRAQKGNAGSQDEVWRQLEKMADKYIVGPSGSASSRHGAAGLYKSDIPVQGIHVLLSTMVLVWLITNSNALPAFSVKVLSLEHSPGKWWSVITDAFVSFNSHMLARNVFLGYMFGRVVENSESTGALWLTYLTSAVGGSIAALLLLPKRAPIQGCANTAAIFGLACIALLFNSRKSWHWHRIFELSVVLPFVIQQLLAGHYGLNQWCILYGQKMGAWVPLVGGFAGAAVAAGVLLLAKAVAGVLAQQQQQQMAGREGPVGASARPQDERMSVLLVKALTQMLRRVL